MSLVIGAAVYIYFKSLACGIASFLAGVLLDIDHIFDCYLNYGTSFNLKNLYSYCTDIKFKIISLVFHSYELLIIFWALIFIFSLGNLWKAIAIGVTQHLIFDQLVNTSLYNLDRKGYFLLFRLKNRFRKEGFVKR